MIVTDWRDADPAVVQSCYDREAQHWLHHLGWDTEQTWSTVEEARVTWGLPGLLALDDGRVDGWTFYTRDGDVLQLGGLVSQTEEATAQLLREVLKAAENAGLPRVSCFVLERAQDLRGELARQGFEIEPFVYMVAPLPRDGAVSLPPGPGTAWREGDIEAAGTLLHASYSLRAARHFAPHGTADEWRHYISTMVDQTACGVFDRVATRVIRDERGMRALAFLTRIAPRTAHLAQFALHPEDRSRGVAGRLMQDTMQLAASTGCDEMTLLVAEANTTARRLYERRGFAPRASFIAARR
jgi:ribosomal protein S18 acetylase RimI-like enzyme